MAVTLEIGPNGSTVMVDPVLRKGLTRRVFRYMEGKRWPDGAVCPACDEAKRITTRKGGFVEIDEMYVGGKEGET